MSNWVGYAVSVNCGETLGCYQGTIVETDGATITLTKAFRNGFPYPKSQVTLNASDIKELRILSVRAERAAAHSTVPAAHSTVPAAHSTVPAPHSTVPAPAAAAPARRARATVCETLQANHTTSTGNQSSSNAGNNGRASSGSGKSPKPVNAARSKPLDIQGSRKNNTMHAGSYGSGSAPKSRGNAFGGRGESTGIPGLDGRGGCGGTGGGGERARRRNEACFGGAAESALDDDFDFEGNLALFDKRAVWASMRNSKPDVVRTADDSKYRHDENVLGAGAAADEGAGLRVPPSLRDAPDYVTDGGCVVPSVLGVVRQRLWEALRREGLCEFALAMVARAACDVALRLVGGGRRLEARNAHQRPSVVALCGAHRGGAAGLAAARLLGSRGARLHALLHGEVAPAPAELRREVRALRADGVPVLGAGQTDALPPAPDLVLVALYDPLEDTPLDQYGALVEWWGARRGVAVCVEPGGGGGWRDGGGGARACVLGGAAVPLSGALGRLYLADVAAPQRIYRTLGLPSYRPPFGAAPALPLHPQTD